MDNIINDVKDNIQEKLDWIIYSYREMQKHGQSKDILSYSFWSFLTGFQQGWYYFNYLMDEINNMRGVPLKKGENNELKKSLINKWKDEKLSEQEKRSWNILNELRNEDAHRNPLKANYEIRQHFITIDGKFLLDNDGSFILENANSYYIIFNEYEYNLDELCDNGIESLRKLIFYLPTLNKLV